MRRTSEITTSCHGTTENASFMSALITGLKSALNETHTLKEESNLKVKIKNTKKKLVALNYK